jgi:hypothetical protein
MAKPASFRQVNAVHFIHYYQVSEQCQLILKVEASYWERIGDLLW